MEKVKKFIVTHKNKIKFIFVCSVFFIVLKEILAIAKTTSGEQLKTILSDVSLIQVLLLLVIGVLSVTPMLLYDFTLNNILHKKDSKIYIAETSWIINTLNNLCGFGGIISSGLRYQFYGKDTEPKSFFKSLSKIWLFLLSGLSIFSLLTLISIFFFKPNPYLQQYWIWLAAGALYFPSLFFITRIQQKHFFDDLLPKDELSLISASFLEWTGVILCFIVTGKVLGIPFTITEIVPLLVASSIIGIISLLPGGVGSFDVMMILGLSNLGIPHEAAIVWLLVYRVAYYVLPFLTGLMMLTKNLGGRINREFDGIPRDLLARLSHMLVSFSLYFSGIMLVLEATVPIPFSRYPLLHKLNPLSFHLLSQMKSIVLGFLLLVLGRGIFSKVKKAYYPTLFVLIGAILYTIFSDFSWGITIFLSLVILLVLLAKTQLYRKQLVLSWEAKSFDRNVYGVLILLYTAIGVYNLPVIHHKHHVSEFLLFPSEKIWFSGFVSICFLAVFIWLLSRYLANSSVKIGEEANHERIKAVLTSYGGNETSQLSLLGDKLIYFYQNEAGEDCVFFQFQIHANKCFIMGEPSGDKQQFKKAIEKFMVDADELSYSLVFYEVKKAMVMELHDLGFDFLKIGEEAHVDIPQFALTGKKFRGERALLNKCEREAYHFAIYGPPFSSDFMKQLKEVSDEWLHGQVEKGFSLGYFDEKYLAEEPIAAVTNQEGKVVAFANIMNTYTSEQVTIDLMRYSDEAPSGIMDYLFISLFHHYQEQNVSFFNMGMAPLSNVGQSDRSFMQERVAFFIYKFGQRFYSFEGLRKYKSKYATKWVPKYTVYPKESSLIFTMLQLIKIINRPIEK